MKKMIIGLMLAVMLVFGTACGADGKNNGNVSQSGDGSIVPDRTEMPEKNDDTLLPEEDGDILPDDGDAIVGDGDEMPDGNDAQNGNGANDTNDTPDATVIPELVPSEEPSASPNGETVQK